MVNPFVTAAVLVLVWEKTRAGARNKNRRILFIAGVSDSANV
jgi:hypothetical protein